MSELNNGEILGDASEAQHIVGASRGLFPEDFLRTIDPQFSNEVTLVEAEEGSVE